MEKYTAGDIVLVRFTFTDLSDHKVRPALVVSSETFNADKNLLLIGIYGNEWPRAYSMELFPIDLEIGELKKRSFFRFHNIFSLEKSLVVKKIARIRPDKKKAVIEKIRSFLG